MGGNYLNLIFKEMLGNTPTHTIDIEVNYASMDMSTLVTLHDLITSQLNTISFKEKEYRQQGQYRSSADSRNEYNGLHIALCLIDDIIDKIKNPTL